MDARVEIVTAGLGSDGALLDAALAAGADGIVAVLLGAGHAPPAFLAACRAAAERVPVVACVRPESGGCCAPPTASRAPSATCAGRADARPALSPAAARIMLMACLGAGYSRVATAAAFAPSDP